MKEIKKIVSNYVSYAELCEIAQKDYCCSAKILLEYVIEEDQWYLKNQNYTKKVTKRNIEKFFSNNNVKIVKQPKRTNLLNRAS